MKNTNWSKVFLLSIIYGFGIILFFIIFLLFTKVNLKVFFQSLFSKEIIYSIKFSFLTSIISSIIVLIVSIPISYGLSRYDFFGKSILKTLIDLPIAFPQLVLGFCLLIFFGNFIIKNLLDIFGINILFTKKSVVIAQVFSALPFSIKSLNFTFDYIDKKLELVSRSLGISKLKTFFKVTLPCARNGLVSSMILAFARSIGCFGTILIISGGTLMKTETLPISLYLNLSYGNIDMAVSSGILLIIISFIAIILLRKVEN